VNSDLGPFEPGESGWEPVRRMAYAGGFVLVSFYDLVLRRLLQLVALRVPSNDFKELEIVVLRHELAILRRQRKSPGLTTVDRLFLAAASRCLSRDRWRSSSSRQRHYCDGIGAWWRNGGPIRTAPAAHRCDEKFETWCSGSRETILGGVINESLVSCRAWGCPSPRRRCGPGYGPRVLGQSARVEERRGASLCAPTDTAVGCRLLHGGDAVAATARRALLH
jgi:hypothetical protein